MAEMGVCISLPQLKSGIHVAMYILHAVFLVG